MKYQMETELHILERCLHKHTLQEVWNKTIGAEQEGRVAEIRRRTRTNN